MIWLLRRLSPDFKTIADFRRINRAAFRQVFREFVRLCRELELFGRELVAVDGTRIKAVNSRKRNFTKAKLAKALAESDERLSRYLDRLDEADEKMVPEIYVGLDPRLIPAAGRSVFSHLVKLVEEGRATADGAISIDTEYSVG